MIFAWRHQYDEARDRLESNASSIDTSEVPENQHMKIAPDPDQPVQKHLAKEADINEIVRRAGLTDHIPPLPMDRDFYEQPADNFGPEITLKEVLEIQRRAKEHFMALPAKTRNYFNNDPARLHDFVNDPRNADKAVELGLLRKVSQISETEEKAAPAPAAPPQTP